VPSIIGAFNQQRGADPTPPPITDPESQRFLGSLLATFVPMALEAAPGILNSIFGGGRREVRSSAW
jgi:hypothetical protein